MKRILLKSISLILLVGATSVPFFSYADFFYDSNEISDCKQKHKNPMDYTLCLDAALVQVERELMSWETNLQIKLEDLGKDGNTDSIRLYKSAQRNFERYKKATCQWQYLATLSDMTSAVIMAKECQIYMVKDRIVKLQEISELKF